jgi:zinc transport system substrate-binding protein
MYSCKTEKRKAPNLVSVSILPQKYFVEKIVKEKFSVNVMIPPGASPATYEPTTKQMQLLSESEVYFRIGHIEFEKTWMSKFMSTNPSLEVVDLSENVNLLEGHTHAHDELNNHSHNELNIHTVDPHIWVSPPIAKTIAKNILYTFERIDRFNEHFYKKNFKNLIKEIDSVHLVIKESLKDLKTRKIIIYHPALTYYAREYNLEQIAIESDGKEPSPAKIKEIIDIAKENGIKKIFIQKQFSKEKAKTIADAIGAEVVSINPLAENWKKSIMHITEQIAKNNQKE